MLIYIILPFAAVISGMALCHPKLNENCKNAGKIIYCSLAGVGLFIISAVRYAVGYDYYLYANWYNSLRTASFEEIAFMRHEKGFLFSLKVLSGAGFEYQAMFVIIAFVAAAGVMLLIYKYSRAPWVSVSAFIFIGLYFISMNFMRQFIAALIISFALRYVTEKRFFRFAGYILFASVFHFSALLLLPFWFVLKIKFNNIILLLMLAGSMIVYIFVTPLMTFVTDYVYTYYDPVTNVEASTGLSPVYTIAFALFFGLAFLLRNMLVRRNKYANVLICSMYFAVFFSFLGTAHAILSRLALLFIIAPVLILSGDIYITLRDLVLLTFKDSKTKRRLYVIILGLVLLFVCGLYYNFLLHDSERGFNGVVPYQTIWGEVSS